jgi:hypothetical protein
LLGPVGQPAAAQKIKITTTFTAQSAGHQHGPGTVQLTDPPIMGWFYGQGTLKASPMVLTTDQFGLAVVDSFISSQVSARFLVTAANTSYGGILVVLVPKDTVKLEVKVPRLVNFRDLIVLPEKPFELVRSPTGASKLQVQTGVITMATSRPTVRTGKDLRQTQYGSSNFEVLPAQDLTFLTQQIPDQMTVA